MPDIDEEVRIAEQMALAVASAPNLRASEAKEMLSKSQRGSSNFGNISSNINNDINNNAKTNASVSVSVSASMRNKRPIIRRRRREVKASPQQPHSRRQQYQQYQQQQQQQHQQQQYRQQQLQLQQPNREILNSADEEVRRAREMAVAVAALGTEKGAMKAEDIRMALANVMSDPNQQQRRQQERKSSSSSSSPNKQQQLQNKGSKASAGTSTSKVDETTKSDSQQTSSIRIRTIMEEMLRPPWILRNQSLFAMVVLANLLILYVTLSSEPSYTKISNAVVIFNTAVSFFCVVEKRNPQNITTILESSGIKNQTNANATMVCDATTATDANVNGNVNINEQIDIKRQEALVDEMEKRLRPEKNITLEWLPDVRYSEVDLEALRDLQPESTLAERRRFLKARKGVIKAASAQLGSYIQWRSANKIDEFFPSTFTTDEEDWALAARAAMEIANNTGGPSPADREVLPRIVSVFGGEDGLVLCKNGARIVHVLPCQLDTTIAPSTTYALALAMYLDRKLDRNHTEKVTVVIDIRSGKGWPNPSSVSLVPFIKLVVGSLNSYFPERLSRCILFPLPMTATVLFNKAKAYLDPDTATKIQVCSGAGSVTSKVPTKVKQFIDEKSVDVMERRRKAFFLP